MKTEHMVTLRLTNSKAIRALDVIGETLEELKETQPWNQEVKRASKALRYAVRKLVLIVEEDASQ